MNRDEPKQPAATIISAIDNRHYQGSLFANASGWHHRLHCSPSPHTDEETAMVISLLLIALQDAWLNIGLSKASGQIADAPSESPDPQQR